MSQAILQIIKDEIFVDNIKTIKDQLYLAENGKCVKQLYGNLINNLIEFNFN